MLTQNYNNFLSKNSSKICIITYEALHILAYAYLYKLIPYCYFLLICSTEAIMAWEFFFPITSFGMLCHFMLK